MACIRLQVQDPFVATSCSDVRCTKGEGNGACREPYVFWHSSKLHVLETCAKCALIMSWGRWKPAVVNLLNLVLRPMLASQRLAKAKAHIEVPLRAAPANLICLVGLVRSDVMSGKPIVKHALQQNLRFFEVPKATAKAGSAASTPKAQNTDAALPSIVSVKQERVSKWFWPLMHE